MPTTWLKKALPLDRPEYSKQTEALLTDLLWRSPGSSLHIPPDSSFFEEYLGGRKTAGDAPLERLVFAKTGQKGQRVVESLPLARTTDVGAVLTGVDTRECLHALLETLRAPRSRSYRSISCVPLHPDLVAFQTLPGIVNKQNPPNVARIIEEVGRLGGADGLGAVAARFLAASHARAVPAEAGITGCVTVLFPHVAAHVWGDLDAMGQPPGPTPWPTWPGVTACTYPADAALDRPFAASIDRTPFRWFWQKWQILCDPANKWIDVLPQRRWVDWALSLLRTALAFSYLWEAELFIRIRDRIIERRAGTDGPARERLNALLGGQFSLAFVQPNWVPPAQKRVWDALSSNLGKGYAVRHELDQWMKDNSSPLDGPFGSSLMSWIDGLSTADLTVLASPLPFSASTANNTKEFVKYLLLPRSADDDASDQGDLYFLARSNRSSFWIELGPEWLVVETSLLAQTPGGKCTLRQLVDDLGMLGIAGDRRTFVKLLEDAGLSSDSPDADEALVIESGF